ncbi:SIP domain-containing protein [Streptomyces sp. NPDC048172]|uniref:SIP domain-containing protein n=1 Tax=Streptomyces sp. NPDC048172 TaxID=3365505 RepID=UPI003711F432
MAGRENKSFPIVLRELEVAEAFDVTPLMRRVVLTGDQLGAFRNNGYEIEPFRTENADDHVKLVLLDGAPDVPVPAQNDGHLDWHPEALGRARDYTPRRYDPEARRLELDFVRHSGGLAADWAERALPGDRVHVAGPRGTTVLPTDIDWYFLVGDETALPAIARRIEELPAGTPVTAVVTVPSASEEQTFDHAADLHLTWVHRDTAGPGALMAAVEAAPWRDGQVYAWAAGESGMLRPLRRWLKHDKEVPAGHTDIAGYWRAGQSQREMGQALHKLRHLSDLSVPYAVRAAVSLDLAELVTDGHTTVPALAAAAGADPGGVRRLLRLLAHEELFALDADDTVRVLPAGAILMEDHAHEHLDERAGHARLHGAWPGLLHAVRTGEAGFPHARGHTFWDELATDERLGRTFDAVLDRWAAQWTPAVVRRLALSDEHVVDVGGGTGAFLGRLLEACPGVRGTLVELPTTARTAQVQFAERGVADRVRIASQSFFEALPDDGDVYLLAQVLHDWPDAEATAILRRVAEAVGDRRVVLVERLVTADLDDHEAAFDLHMYAVFGSGERTREEYASLAASAGLRLDRTVRIRDGLHMLELRRAAE